uniref:InlB B-repeat-containing protein n=2 Tax=Bacteria TaxID=2 RepID=UPI00288AF72B
MNNKKIFEKIITEKRAKSSNERPKYGLRKLTVGVVSCLLGYMMFMTPNVTLAEKVEAKVESTEAANAENVEKDSEQPKEEAVESKITEQPVSHVETYSSNAKETNAQDRTIRTTTEETSETEAASETATEEKATEFKLTDEQKKQLEDAGLTEEEIAFVEADINKEINDNSNFNVDEYIVKVIELKKAGNDIIPEATALEVSEDGADKKDPQGATKAEEALPKNRKDKANWEDEVKKGKDHWELGKSDKLKDQRLVRVTTSDPIEMADINYQGSFVDGNGRTNLRMVYMEKSSAISGVWKKAAFNFGDLYDKIDFEKSYAVDEKGNRYSFSNTNNNQIKTLDVSSMISLRTQNKNNLPINIVLKDGTTINNLNNQNYKVQMRLVDKNNERVYSFAPGKSAMDYSTYTKSTSISLGNNIESEFNRGPKQEKGDYLAVQRSFLSELIANPDQYPDTSNLGILRTQYQSETGANPGNTTDGKPHGFVQMFDAELVKYLKPDQSGFVAYTQLLNANRSVNKSAKRVGLTLDDINYTKDGKLAYFVIANDNYKKDGVKVVRVDSLRGSVEQSGIHFTGIDYVIDKTKLPETFQTTGKDKVNFNVMTGWMETNPKGWTIFEEEYDHDFVIPEGESFTFDLGKDPEGKNIMVQIGDEVHSFIRTQHGYYASYKGGDDSFEKIEQVKKGAIPIPGLYKLTLREGATIKKGDKFRILLPDSTDHDAKVNILEATNGTKYNQGGALLSTETDRNINMHLYRKDKGSFKLYYTLKGETERKVLEFTQGILWKYKDTDKVLTGVPNTATDPSGGNFWINVKKLEPGTDIVVEAYNEKGELEADKTSSYRFNEIEKSKDRYTKMAWVDHTENLSNIGIAKSLYTPHQNVFTNDYTGDQYKDFYEDPRQNPESEAKFMTNTESLLGFTRYDGGKIRMRYIDPNGVVYVEKADAEANEYDKDGNTTKDYTKTITVNGKQYVASPYTLTLSELTELRSNAVAGKPKELTKDMRLLVNASDGSSLPSDWLEVKVKTRVLFNTTEGKFEDGSNQSVRVVPDNIKFSDQEGYVANGFTGANVKVGTGDEFVANPTAEGKTFLGWVTAEGKAKLGKTIVKAEDYNNLDASMKFTSETPVTTHQVVYAVWSEETALIKFDANGGKFADDSTTKTDDITDGVDKPADPTQDGKEFLGWASTKDATAPEEGILDNVTEAKTVYAVWKDAAQETTAKPEITAPKAGDKEIKGKAEPNAKVVVELPDGTKVETTADKDGNFTAKVPEGKEPKEGETVKATATVDGKKPSEEATATTGKADPTEATAKPEITAPKAGDK